MSETQSPSARMVAEAQQTTTLTDAIGRKLTFRLLSVLDQARILKAIGPAQADNGPYVRIACIAASVVEIDGVPCPKIVNDAGIEAAIGRLGDEGFAAIDVEATRRGEAATKAAQDASEASQAPLGRSEPSPETQQ